MKDNQAYYLEWSTVSDAPTTLGMTKEEFREYYQKEYGLDGIRRHYEEKMELVEEKGISSRFYKNVNELIYNNRAGPNEENLTKEEIIEHYCDVKEKSKETEPDEPIYVYVVVDTVGDYGLGDTLDNALREYEEAFSNYPIEYVVKSTIQLGTKMSIKNEIFPFEGEDTP